MEQIYVVVIAILLQFAGHLEAGNVRRKDIVVTEIGDQPLQAREEVRLFSDTQPPEENENDVDVVINLDSYVNNVGPRFVGVTLDSSFFRGRWQHLNITSKQLLTLARGLAPSFIRNGGTAADFFIFKPTADESEETVDNESDDSDYKLYDYEFNYGVDKPIDKNFTVTGKEWKQFNQFVQNAGWDLIFDFNEFLRTGDRWDPDNARELLTFSQEHNFSIPCFQIGNEPNSYHHHFNFSIPGSRMAKDMQQVRSLLATFPAYSNSCIMGPDVTKMTKRSARDYLEEFLTTGGQNIVAAVTLHHYYFNARTHGARLSDFVNTTILNLLKLEISIAQSITQALAPKLPLWFSETSSVSGGGLAGVSDRYVAGFMWLDKLGLSAVSGFKAVLRQSFLGINYALVSLDLDPYPDYFLTVLYKRLVQGPVFNVTSSTDSVRMYASCANPSSYQKGAVTVYVLNVRNETVTLNFTQFSGHKYDLYLLTPGDSQGLQSLFVALNGEKLVMINEELPPLRPLICTGRITFPAYSFGFVVIPHAGVQLCS